MARQEEKSKSTRRVLEIKEQRHQEIIAILMCKARERREAHRRAMEIIVSRGEELKHSGIVPFLFLFWRTTVHADFLKDSVKSSLKSARRRQVSQENDPPRNGVNHATQALPRPPHGLNSGDRPVLQSADAPIANTLDQQIALQGQIQSPCFPPRDMNLRHGRQQSASTSWLPDMMKFPYHG